MIEKECVPFAPSLIESMRSLGYSFQTAVADLIDNSISAEATEIKIISYPHNNPYLVIFDNGTGMTNEELFKAMRYGSTNPLEERNTKDLGRFGLGLKSASLSQCRKLYVVSKKNNEISSYAWDLDYVVKRGAWLLKEFSREEIDDEDEFPHIKLLTESEVKSGTYICLKEFDRIEAGTARMSETFTKCLNKMRDHLSLVFHRFIEEDGLKIEVNNTAIEARDPFVLKNTATQKLEESRIDIDGQKIILKPFVLPYLSKIKNKEMIKAGGRESLKTEQGFYIYRNKRLVIWGTWFGNRKDELYKYARVCVDIPNSIELDKMWSIDIKKSTAILPDRIKDDLLSAFKKVIEKSERVCTHRGRKEKTNNDIEHIWEKIKDRDGYRYIINRNIPQIKMLEETLNDKQIKMVDSVISRLEESFPSFALYIDYRKGNIEENKSEDSEESKKVWEELQKQIDFIKDNNLDLVKYYRLFLNTEPFCNYEDIKKKIKKEIKKYE